ncbi:Aspartic proteinase nepenthesin-2 [Morella rubra]|uniref:Aspartic proteinase nepenthesin-2 n=1 Tax=Morella rubra TaxID=262757 RepID=A0A6A1WAV1_9ROSI|nr:Aspartic proteinase nepenthesin-2 [Morella rubra]
MVSMSPLYALLVLPLLLFTFTDLCRSQNTTTTEYLKLPLLRNNPFASPTEVLSYDAYRLSVLHNSETIKSPVVSGASSGSGQYFVSLRFGTPPQTLLLVADTGSDLVWVKCSACKTNCSNTRATAFLARQSSTFSLHHCFDSSCRLVPNPPHSHCNRTRRVHTPCLYEYSYIDGSVTSGFFSKETTTLQTSSGREARLKNVAFGCGFRISGPSVTGASFNGAHGVMGLGRGPISFSSQLGRRFGNKFSYCLRDYTISPPPTSFLSIGNDVVRKTSKMSFTPLQTNPLNPSFYYIGIQTVSVNHEKLPIDPSVWSINELGNGGTVVDSGTTLTFLAEPAYLQVLEAVKRQVRRLPITAVPSQSLGFDLCLNVSGLLRPRLPKLSFKLVGNSLFSPPPRNYFIEAADGVKCLAIQPVKSETGFSVIGNLMQQGFLLEFDSEGSRLGSHGMAGRPTSAIPENSQFIFFFFFN